MGREDVASPSPLLGRGEDPEHLGEELSIPEMHTALRPELELALTAIVNRRTVWHAEPTA